MPRRKLTAKEKRIMQAARTTAKAEKIQAAKALVTNSQFTNYKFWKTVDPDTVTAIEKAIAQAKKAIKGAEIKALEKKLAKLRADA